MTEDVKEIILKALYQKSEKGKQLKNSIEKHIDEMAELEDMQEVVSVKLDFTLEELNLLSLGLSNLNEETDKFILKTEKEITTEIIITNLEIELTKARAEAVKANFKYRNDYLAKKRKEGD